VVKAFEFEFNDLSSNLIKPFFVLFLVTRGLMVRPAGLDGLMKNPPVFSEFDRVNGKNDLIIGPA